MFSGKQVAVRTEILLVFGLLCFALGLSAQTSQSNLTVRVMTANLNGDVQSIQPFAVRLFQGLQPDIVAIQEFNYSNNAAADFRSLLDTAFGTNFVYFRENYPGSGDIPNGIISRFPILASGSWSDTVQTLPNRGFAWAKLGLPGTNTMYVVSVHLLTSSAGARASEAFNLTQLIQSNFPTNAWVVLAGDFNTDTRTEAAMTTFETIVSDSPIPTDAESGGNSDTSANRNHPHDYVLPSFALTNLMTPSRFPSHSFSRGLVFDSRVYTPLSDVVPVQLGDSGSAQHMAVLKDFQFAVSSTNLPPSGPTISVQPQSQSTNQGSEVTFTVTATGAAPLSYQWRFNGANLDSETASTYTRTNVQAADAGGYSVVVTNLSGGSTSSIAVLTVNGAPVIAVQPQNQSVFAGQNATFSVSVTGATPFIYQWRFNGTTLPGALDSSFTRTNVQSADAGNYSVTISNAFGGAISVEATLTVATNQGTVIAQWNFNSLLADTNTATGTTAPSIGTGTASLVGGVTQTFASGSPTDTGAAGTDNSAWNTAAYPAQGTGNKTAGVQFSVSTGGRQNISIRWDHRASNTGSKYVRLRYTTNGTDFIDYPTASVVPTTFGPMTNNLSAIPGANDNPNFAFRLVAEFESSAAGTSNPNFVGAGGTYGSAGTLRYDMVTVSGTPIPQTILPSPARLSAPSFVNSQFQFTLTATSGSNYLVQTTTNLAATNWSTLYQTNVPPFSSTSVCDPSAGFITQRFYRVISLP